MIGVRLKFINLRSRVFTEPQNFSYQAQLFTLSFGANPSVKACWQYRDIYDEDDNYVKTLCDLVNLANYDSALKACKKYGMTLFEVTSQVELEALQNYALTETGGETDFYYSGRSDLECNRLVAPDYTETVDICYESISGFCQWYNVDCKPN